MFLMHITSNSLLNYYTMILLLNIKQSNLTIQNLHNIKDLFLAFVPPPSVSSFHPFAKQQEQILHKGLFLIRIFFSKRCNCFNYDAANL